MDRLKHIFVIAFLLIYNQATIAQSKYSISELNDIDKKINESIYINTNANVFLTGETLFYKLLNLDNITNSISIFSKLAYVELIDSNKKSIFKQKLFLEKGVSGSDFFIPTTLETGNYKLISYTTWMLNKSNPDYFITDIFIINPYQVNIKKTTNSVNSISITETKKTVMPNTDIFSVSTNKKTYSTRENITLNIKKSIVSNNMKGNYTVSVRKSDGLSTKNKPNISEFLNVKKKNRIENKFKDDLLIIPEFRGEIISGKIISKIESKNIENKNISLSIPGKNFAFEITKTNKKGDFVFNIEKCYTSSNIIIQLIDSDKENFKIELNQNPSPNFDALTFNEFILNQELKKEIEEKAVANQIENAYYEKKKDSLTLQNDYKLFYNSLSTDYILDDFTRFPTLKETTIEVIEGMYFTTNDKKYTLHLRDFDLNNKLDIPALVILDGLIIQDINELFDHKADLIYKISIIKGGYYFGSKLYNGLISFTTKQYNYESKLNGDFIIKSEILRPVAKKEYFQPNYSQNSSLSRIPDFRQQLLWIPELNLDKEEQISTFFTSDIKGKFEIILEGFSDTGIPVYESEIIEVK